MRRILLGAVSLFAAAVMITGCSAGLGGSRDESVDSPGVVGGPTVEDGSAGGGDGAQAPSDRDVIVTGRMTLTVDDPIATAREAARIVEAAGGRIDARTERAPTPSDRGSATLVLRIPAPDLQDVLDDIAELGRADEIATESLDVTNQVQDLDARISALETTIDRLTIILAQASDVEDLIRLETEIANRQAELERLEAQRRDVADQVAMSTITLYVRSEAAAPAPDPGDFWSGVQTGWNAFVAFFAGLLVGLGVLLPWIVFAGVVAGVIILIVKLARRRRARVTTTGTD